jgi:hypothetical protein
MAAIIRRPLARWLEQGEDIVYTASNGGEVCDVGSSHPGAVVGPKGPAVRRLKRYAIWVQNVEILRLHRVIDGCPLAISVKPDVGLDRDRRGNTEGSQARVRLDPVTTESVSSRSCVSVAQAANLRPRSHANSSQCLVRMKI